VTTSGRAADLRASWQANRDAIERWGRYYGVPAEILLAMTGTESANFNGRSARVEPLTTPRSRLLRNAQWRALGCGAFPGGAVDAPSPPPAGACAAYSNWFASHDAVRAQVMDAPNNGIVPASPGGNALVNDITTIVEAVAPGWISPGIIQTLVETARASLAPEFGAASPRSSPRAGCWTPTTRTAYPIR
jgi:hypothetical protein